MTSRSVQSPVGLPTCYMLGRPFSMFFNMVGPGHAYDGVRLLQTPYRVAICAMQCEQTGSDVQTWSGQGMPMMVYAIQSDNLCNAMRANRLRRACSAGPHES
jgi:hypothetical protein